MFFLPFITKAIVTIIALVAIFCWKYRNDWIKNSQKPIRISNGLYIVNCEGWNILLKKIMKHMKDLPEGTEFKLLQTKKGCRVSVIYPGLKPGEIPESNNEKLNSALREIERMAFQIFGKFRQMDPVLQMFEYEFTMSFHIYYPTENGEHGFTPHHDFGTIAIVFTMGKDFEYSEDGGKTWISLSEHDEMTPNSVIVNLGRLYHIHTGEPSVLHRVSSKGTLSEYGFPDIAKFTIGFFIEIEGDTPIVKDIPDNIQGVARYNWKFLINNCETYGDYTMGMIEGRFEPDEEGLLHLAK